MCLIFEVLPFQSPPAPHPPPPASPSSVECCCACVGVAVHSGPWAVCFRAPGDIPPRRRHVAVSASESQPLAERRCLRPVRLGLSPELDGVGWGPHLPSAHNSHCSHASPLQPCPPLPSGSPQQCEQRCQAPGEQCGWTRGQRVQCPLCVDGRCCVCFNLLADGLPTPRLLALRVAEPRATAWPGFVCRGGRGWEWVCTTERRSLQSEPGLPCG